MAITINGSGTITGISAGGLPDGSVTADDIESTLDLSGKTVTLPSGTGGKVLQVVSYFDSANSSTTSTSPVATTLTASITPSSTSNKVLVMVDFFGSCASYGTPGAYFWVYKNGSDLTGNFWVPDSANYSFDAGGNGSIQYLDLPSTTSSITYTLYYQKGGTATAYYNRGSNNGALARSSITLMEIAP